jgi:LysR family hydrogen peroxide-inducible transcriptional activator
MNIRDIKYFVAVAKIGHFGKAAEHCFISQPTLSGQIKKLEEELGVVLFERTRRSVVITPLGKQILIHAQLLLEQVNAIQQLANIHRDPFIEPLRIGIIPTLSPYLLPIILEPLQRYYSKLKLIISEDLTDSLYKQLRDHKIDAALFATIPSDADIETTPLFDEPFWLAYPHGHRLSVQSEITHADLETIELLLLADGHCLTQQVMKVCQQVKERSLSNIADVRATSLETLLQLVGAGFGCTLVPALAVPRIQMLNTNVILRALSLPDSFRQIHLVYRCTYPRQPVLLALSKLIVEHLPNLVTPAV